MSTVVNLYSTKNNEILKFLEKFYNKKIELENPLKWEKSFSNSIEIADVMGTFIDNNDSYFISMWISLDDGLFINVTDDNINDLIKYLFERFPYD